MSTNAKHKSVSSAYQQTIRAVRLYVSVNAFLILIGLRTGDIRLFDWKYWSVQIWIAWNFGFSLMLLINLTNTKRAMCGEKSMVGNLIASLKMPRISLELITSYQIAIGSFLFGFLIGLPLFMLTMQKPDITEARVKATNLTTPTITPVVTAMQPQSDKAAF